MNRATFFLLGSLVLLLNCVAVHGQGCSALLEPHFSVYTSIYRDGNNINTSVTIQGYANIAAHSGCNMSIAVHHVGAENKLNNIDHWSYSATGCPTCYFSTTSNEAIVGVPGVLYPWDWDGASICSIVGTFYSVIGSGGLPGCLVPSTETTTDKGFNGASFREQFDMTISDTTQDSFDGYYDQEVTTSPGSNTCWWPRSGLVQNPGVIGSQWTVGTVAGVSEHNHWGFDSIGWDLPVLDNIVNNGPANGVTFPCVTTIHQGMQIMCNANTYWQYRTDDITITVDSDRTVEACRAGVCSAWEPFSYWQNGRQSTQWARVLKSRDAHRPPSEDAPKEAR